MQTDPVQRMGWAQTDPIKKGRACDSGSRQETELDLALNSTKGEKVQQEGQLGKKVAKGKPVKVRLSDKSLDPRGGETVIQGRGREKGKGKGRGIGIRASSK